MIGVAAPAWADLVQYFYDGDGRLTAAIDPLNGSAVYSYDDVGNILSVVRNPLSALVLAQIMPSAGAVGSTVTLSGTGFGTTANTTVSFNGTSATLGAVTAGSITVAVPTGATTGPVMVTTPAGSVTTAANFSVTGSSLPTISGLSPMIVAPNGLLTITGSGFDPNLANDKIFINGRFAGMPTDTSSSLAVGVPTVMSGRVTVETPNGSATTPNYLAVPPTPYTAASVSSLTPGTIGGTATATINTAGQIALVVFDGVAGQRFAFQTSTSAIGGGSAQFYNADGSKLGPSYGLNATSGVFVLPTTTTYSIVVLGGGATGSAAISLYNVPPDVTGSLTVDGGPASLTTTIPGQNLQWTFNGTAGGRISLQVGESNGLGPCCDNTSITDPDGKTALYSGSFYGSIYTDLLITPVSGTYTILVDPVQAHVGTATLNLRSVAPDVAGTLSIGGSPSALTTTTPSQNMQWTFAGTAGGRISVELAESNGLGGCCDQLTIVEPDGATKLYNSNLYGTAFTDLLIMPTTGSYTVLVNPVGMNFGTATVTLRPVAPDLSATLTIGGAASSLTTTTPGQNMQWTFAGTAGTRISLQVLESNGLGHCCDALTITDPDGKTQLYNTTFYGSLFSDVLSLPTTGSYTISLNPVSVGVGTATLTLRSVAPDAAGTLTIDGASSALTTTTPDQNMQWTFTGTAGGRITLQIQESNGLGSGGVDKLTIVEPDGKTTLYNSDFATTTFTDVLVMPTAGTYTVLVNPVAMGVGTATATLRSVAPDANATLTPGGGSVGVSIVSPGQNAALSFTGTLGSRVSLLVQEDANLGKTWNTLTIREPDGKTQLYNNTNLYPTTFTGVLPAASPVVAPFTTLPLSGTYAVSYNPSGLLTGNATFTLYAVPADVSAALAINSAPVNLAVTVPGQSVRGTFSGAANQGVTVKVGVVSEQPANGGCLAVTTLEPDGHTVLRSASACGAGYNSGSLTLPVSGIYTVVVSPSGTTLGTFGLSVSSP